MAAFLTTLLVLAVVGWSIGWLAAGTDLAGHNIDPSTPASTATTHAPRSASPSPTPSASLSNAAFAMPNLLGMKFRTARQKAFDLRLGVTIHFDEPGKFQPGTVARTSPLDSVLVRPGYTIVLYVTGPAPKVTVPDVVGKSCGDGKDALIDAGLRIDSYPSGDKGTVVKIDPPASTERTWNDGMLVYCVQAGASP